MHVIMDVSSINCKDSGPFYELDHMLSERDNYVAAYDLEDQNVALFTNVYADWNENQLPQSTVPAIGTKQVVEPILRELKIQSNT